MRRIVLDTMVLASSFTSDAGASGLLVQQWRSGEYGLLISEHILDELARTLGQDRYFSARTTSSEVSAILALLRAEAIVTPLSMPVVGVATQPKDDLVLSTALNGGDLLALLEREALA